MLIKPEINSTALVLLHSPSGVVCILGSLSLFQTHCFSTISLEFIWEVFGRSAYIFIQRMTQSGESRIYFDETINRLKVIARDCLNFRPSFDLLYPWIYDIFGYCIRKYAVTFAKKLRLFRVISCPPRELTTIALGGEPGGSLMRREIPSKLFQDKTPACIPTCPTRTQELASSSLDGWSADCDEIRSNIQN